MGEVAIDLSVLRPMVSAADDIIRMDGVGWADYQRLLAIRGDRSVPRLTYLDGVLELMSPSRSHELIKSMLGRLLEAWCLEKGVDITPYGAWTLENKDALRGAEPDECYVLGDHEQEVTSCDLAIEVIWTSGSINKLDVYCELGVKEVWIWQDAGLRVFQLQDRQYQERPNSMLLPDINLKQLLEFMDVKPMTRAVRAYRTAIAS